MPAVAGGLRDPDAGGEGRLERRAQVVVVQLELPQQLQTELAATLLVRRPLVVGREDRQQKDGQTGAVLVQRALETKQRVARLGAGGDEVAAGERAQAPFEEVTVEIAVREQRAVERRQRGLPDRHG